MFPFCVGEHLLHQEKDERNPLNDLAGIAILGPCGYGIPLFSDRTLTKNLVGTIVSKLIFIGTTLYVKSMMRERKNPLYLKASIIFH